MSQLDYETVVVRIDGKRIAETGRGDVLDIDTVARVIEIDQAPDIQDGFLHFIRLNGLTLAVARHAVLQKLESADENPIVFLDIASSDLVTV